MIMTGEGRVVQHGGIVTDTTFGVKILPAARPSDKGRLEAR